MPTVKSDGLRIAYERFGEGTPLLLVHGFASNLKTNWVDTGWVDHLVAAGYAPYALDNRGHGASDKVYDPQLYPARTMARDSAALIRYLLDVGEIDEPITVMGYSMGARISTFLAIDFPELVSGLIIGGMGENMLQGHLTASEVIAALRAPSLSQVTGETGRLFRRFAESTQSDLEALACCMEAGRTPVLAEDLARLNIPALVAVGEKDDMAGPPQPLADLMPKGEAVVITNRTHMTATGDKLFKDSVVEFLNRISK